VKGKAGNRACKHGFFCNDYDLEIKGMRKWMILVIFTGCAGILAAQPAGYEVTGKIEGSDGEMFILQRLVNGRPVSVDSARSVKGVFVLNKGSVEFPEMVNLLVPEKKQNVMFFIENTRIQVEGSIDSLQMARITGSRTHDELMEYRASLRPMDEKRVRLTNEFQAASAALMNEVKETQISFIREHPGSFTVPQLLRSLYDDITAEGVGEIISRMDSAVKTTPMMKEVISKMNADLAVSVGRKAPDFTLNDLNNVPLTLSSLKGHKLLLLDFWAAWCKPCRVENPNIVRIFREFHSRGFDILGISLDRKKEDWKNAIMADRLTWKHVSDLKYFSGPVAKLYNVTTIPASFLLDENGVIIAKNLRGDELYQAVRSRLGNE
jgi:peroxiredoxin